MAGLQGGGGNQGRRYSLKAAVPKMDLTTLDEAALPLTATEAAQERAKRHVRLLEDNQGILEELLEDQSSPLTGDLDHMAAKVYRSRAEADAQFLVEGTIAHKEQRAVEVRRQLALKPILTRWLRLIMFSSRTQLLTQRWAAVRNERAAKRDGAEMIQKIWRKQFDVKMTALVTEMKQGLSIGMLMKMKLQCRVIRRRIAAQRARSYFTHFGKMSVALVAGMFYGCVKNAQRLIRSVLVCRRARASSLTLLLKREVERRRDLHADAQKAAAEEQLAQLTPGNRRRSTLQQELQKIYAEYDYTHANVLGILGLTEEGEGLANMAQAEHDRHCGLMRVAEAYFSKRMREHVAEHAEAHAEALVLYDAPLEGRRMSVEEMRKIVNKSAHAQAVHLYSEAKKERPRWPMLLLYSKVRKDEALMEDLELKFVKQNEAEVESCNVALELPPEHFGDRTESAATA